MFFDISVIRITFRHACMYLSLPRVQCITPIDVSVAINHLPSNRSIIEDTSRAGGTCRAHPDVGSSPLHPFSLSLSSPLAERLLISAVGRCCTLLLRSFLNTRAQEETWAWVLESCCHDRERYRGRCSGRFSVGSTTGAPRMGRGGEPCVWLLATLH